MIPIVVISAISSVGCVGSDLARPRPSLKLAYNLPWNILMVKQSSWKLIIVRKLALHGK
jgi:hypothetical protein